MFAGNFTINVLDYEYNKKVNGSFDLMYQHNLIPTVNKAFNHGLFAISWGEINCSDPAYKQLFNIFNSIYEMYFPKVVLRLQSKHI